MASDSSLGDWLDSLDATELRDVVDEAIRRSPVVFDVLDMIRVSEEPDPSGLWDAVERALSPFDSYDDYYDYDDALEYAEQAQPVVDLLVRESERASSDLVQVVARALELATRAIMVSDDSSGAIGMMVEDLMAAHVAAVRTSQPPLDAGERQRLVKWLIDFRYSGKQDYFDPDIVEYAPYLSKSDLAQYRKSLEALDLQGWDRLPLRRLAVLSGDAAEIIAANGGESNEVGSLHFLVRDLEQAGLRQEAVRFAKRGVERAEFGHHQGFVEFLIDDARERGRGGEEVSLAQAWFDRFPGWNSFSLLHEVATAEGAWEPRRPGAEAELAKCAPERFIGYLLENSRNQEAWETANARSAPSISEGQWIELCKRRARTHPAEVLPVYRGLVQERLKTAHVSNYPTAAMMLVRMRDAAHAAGDGAAAEFESYLAQVLEANRRRPRCMEEFNKAGLMSG